MQERQSREGQLVGRYRLERLLGRGGFAEVYLGKHIHLNRPAAIKILHAHLSSQEDIDSFLREAQIIASLDHPNIVRVSDCDVQDGVPFLVMDYLPNGTLRQRHPRGTRVPLSYVVGYVQQVAQALQHAHDQRLIHRDVKPENMLIGKRGEIVLSDFGIAAIAHNTSSMTLQASAGTIPYMAPEQIQSQAREASDQYALGIVIYEWLSGERPFTGSPTEIFAKHLMTPPPPLLQKVSTLPAEVEQVLQTALAKEPRQRFSRISAFASAFAQASRTTATQPLLDRAVSAPLPPATALPPTLPAAPISGPLVPPTVARSAGSHDTEDHEKLKQTGASQPVVITTTNTPSKQPPVNKSPTVSSSQEQPPVRKLPETVRAMTDKAPSSRLRSAATPSRVPVAPAVPSSSLAAPARQGQHTRRTVIVVAGLVGVTALAGGGIWVWEKYKPGTPGYISANIHPYTYGGHAGSVFAVVWSPNYQYIASCGADNTVQVWNALDGSHIHTYTGHQAPVNSVAWSPDSKSIASGSVDTTVQTWDALTRANAYTYTGHAATVNSVSWSPSANSIASGGEDHTVQVWSAFDGASPYTYTGHGATINGIAWSPGGDSIASASGDKTVQVWKASNGSGVYIYRGHAAATNSVSWSSDGNSIVSGSDDATAQVWNRHNHSRLYTYKGHSDKVTSVAWSPDGNTIVSGSDDTTVQLWSAQDGSHRDTYVGHTDIVTAVCWSPDSAHIASASDDGAVRVGQPV